MRPCLNGATCIDTAQGYSCQCHAGFTDKDCGTSIGPKINSCIDIDPISCNKFASLGYCSPYLNVTINGMNFRVYCAFTCNTCSSASN